MRTPGAVVIVGFGDVAERFYLPAAARTAAYDVAAVVEPDAARREQAHQAAPNVCVVSSLAKLPAIPDAVALVLTPVTSHASLTRELLGRGFHVFSEKTPAQSLAEWQDLVGVARATHRLLLSAPTPPYGRGAEAVRATLGGIGEVVSVSAFVATPGPAGRGSIDGRRAWFYEAGNDPMGDVGVYALAYLVRLFGAPSRCSWAHAGYVPEVGVDDSDRSFRATAPAGVCGLMQWESGIVGTIEVAYRPRRPHRAELQIHGVADSVAVDVEAVDDTMLPREGIATAQLPVRSKFDLAFELIDRVASDRALLERHWQDVSDWLALVEDSRRRAVSG